ncbi:Dimethylaniline monooxygenase [N-oxide-forming] 5, partial [Sciurus carolinensis]|nr:Dimethylaniline monooxygenase [N-oxide-forming] 5 [Sciurus carolinensis]
DFISLRNAYLSNVGIGLSANTILLLFHIFTFLLQCRLKPTELLTGLLTLIYTGVMATWGYIATNAFMSQDFGDDIKYKSIIYLHWFSRGFSLCATCILTFLQVIILSPRSSCLTKFNHIFPHHSLCFLVFLENPEKGRVSIYKLVIINTSKERMCFSEYTIPDHYLNFMHNSQVLEYFKMYAKDFNLLKGIQFKTVVYSVKKRPDFSNSGQWEVVTECEGKREVNVFDGVILCTGHHTNAHLPLKSFPGE